MATELKTTSVDIFAQISGRIIKEQELIIGPVAWDEAKKVQGLSVIDEEAGKVALKGDAKEILNRLVSQYAKLFGQASTEACKEAVQDLIVELPQGEVPSNLR